MTEDNPPKRSTLRWIAVIIIAAVALFFIYRFASPSTSKPKTKAIWASGVAQSYDEAVTRLAKEAAANAEVARLHGDDFLAFSGEASNWIGLGKLTGSPGEFAKAQAALDKGFALAIKGSGPNDIQASQSFALHRFDQAIAALDAMDGYAVPVGPALQASHVSMRADIAFLKGKTAQALAQLDEAQKLDPQSEASCRRAGILWRTGNAAGASRSLSACEGSAGVRTPQFAAYILAQRGIFALNSGDWDEAERQFAEANRIFPGDWKVEARLALIGAAKGDVETARKTLERLARPDERPEIADSLANLHRQTGNGAEARKWADRAGAIWQRYVSQFPEAYWGHARDHELAFGSPRLALALAAKDARNRPYGEALIGLARAWAANQRPDYALALLDKARATGWRSADAERVREEVLTLLGKTDAAEDAREAALALDPRIYDPARARIWLDH